MKKDKDFATKIQELQELGDHQKAMADLIQILTQENAELRQRIIALEVILEKAEIQLVALGIMPKFS